MPEVNLLKDTQGLDPNAPKKPVVPQPPELTNPEPEKGAGLGGIFKSLFNRAPKTMPVASVPPPSAANNGLGRMSVGQPKRSNERILSETKRTAPAVIPLPEDEDASFNVNLLSEDLVATVNIRQRGIVLGIVAVGTLVVVGLLYGGLVLYGQNIHRQITDTTKQLADVRVEISKLQTVQVTALTAVDKLSAIRSLIDRHTRWTKFFSLVEKYTLDDVTYGPAFSGELSGTVTLSATTSTYEEVARQYLIFEQLVHDGKFISMFSITGANAQTSKDGPTKVTFTVAIQLLPTDFTMTADEFNQALSTNPSSNLSTSAPTSSLDTTFEQTLTELGTQTPSTPVTTNSNSASSSSATTP